MQKTINSSPLGKKSSYISFYNPDLLFPIPREEKRREIGILEKPPFKGFDIWNAYEFSWLNAKGKPQVAVAEFLIPCESFNIIESKSLKLYLNSFNQSRFSDKKEVGEILLRDLSESVKSSVELNLFSPAEFYRLQIRRFEGTCLDDLDVAIDCYTVNPSFLSHSSDFVEEVLYSDLLKSNCLVTGQPDWASVEIKYKGLKIDREGLLRYIVSFREHDEFHEQCVERIFMDILRYCKPERLTVYARYTRRGGIDINPFRSNYESKRDNRRTYRQ